MMLAGMQTTKAKDTSTLRYKDKDAAGVEIKVEEETSKDSETEHDKEVVGYMAFAETNP